MEPKLFFPQNNVYAEEFKQFLPVNINLRFETLSSHLVLCEENYVRPLLGGPLFDRLATYAAEQAEPVTTEVAETTEAEERDYDGELLDKVRFALIRLSVWKGYDVIASNISDTGVSSEVDRENRLYRYQEENVKRSLKDEGFNYLDNVLEYLEENSQHFSEFEQSDYVLHSKDSLIHNTAMFNKYYNIENSRLVFLKMQYYLRDVELVNLQHRIGHAFYEELLKADSSTEKYKYVLEYVRRFAVYAAVAEGIGELHKMPTDKGLLFESSTMEGVQETPVYRSQIAETRERFAYRADQYLTAAIHYLKEHAADFPKFINFVGESPEDGIIRRDNTNRKIFLT